METLDYLISKGLLREDGRPIKPDGDIKIVKGGVIFQQQCRNGLRYDIAVSWLQKAIRRGLTDEALYCAYHIADLGKIFRSHLLNRLIVILSEDIGPAEPMLAEPVIDLYFTARQHEADGDIDLVRNAIMAMIHLLSASRKSRITDWTIHSCEGREPDSESYDCFEDMTLHAVHLCSARTKCPQGILVQWDDEVAVKQLEVYNLWCAVLAATSGYDIYRDVVALLRAFMVRGPQYGLLHLVHAISLCFLIDDVEEQVPVINNLPNWDELANLNPPVMNDAVDMHTFYGRKYLGRGMMEFMLRGSKLANWTPFPGEKGLIKAMLAEIEPPEVEASVPRPYQSKLVNETVAHLDKEQTGWLLMACGTGKTKTSYWTMQKVREARGNKGLFVVVTPRLQILRQFHSCWAAMNRLHKTKTMTGILASNTDVFAKDEYTNYEYLRKQSDVEGFLAGGVDTKVIFTTYSSLGKLLGWAEQLDIVPDLTVYDEAHHAKTYKVFGVGRELFLTATPPKSYGKFGEIIGSYDLRDAINDGYLTKYEVNVMECPDEVESLAYVVERAKKTIVFCKTNAAAKDFEQEWLDRGGNAKCTFYVDCKTSKRKRNEIFKAFHKRKRAVIFNCAILGEGVDFTDCDGIFIHSGYKSVTRVVQAMGRPLRLKEGKTEALIAINDDGAVEKRIKAMELYDPEVRDHMVYVS